MTRAAGWWSAGLAVAVAVAGGTGRAADPPAPATVYTGKVRPTSPVLERLGITTGLPVVLVGDGGETYSLVPDAKSRMLFLDPQLHNRPVRLTARPAPGPGALKVEKVQTVKDGKVYDVDYWCEPCQLSAAEPGACKCCGGPTTLRELPAK